MPSRLLLRRPCQSTVRKAIRQTSWNSTPPPAETQATPSTKLRQSAIKSFKFRSVPGLAAITPPDGAAKTDGAAETDWAAKPPGVARDGKETGADGYDYLQGYNKASGIHGGQMVFAPNAFRRILNDCIMVKLEEDLIARFDTIFLRDSCTCHRCVDEHSGQKRFATSQIRSDIQVSYAKTEPDLTLKVWWIHDIAGFPSTHHSTFSRTWLQTQVHINERSAGVRRNTPPALWDKQQMQSRFQPIPYDSFMNDGQDFADALKNLDDTGLICLSGVPESEKAVEDIALKLGPIRETFYGRTWDVKDKPNADNVAYTSDYLGMHMDLLYMKEPPGIQLLHCLKSSCEGGESMFIDSFWAAKVLFDYAPQAFQDLARFPVTYKYDSNGYFYTDEKPTFEVFETDPMNPLHKSFRLINVNWSPPFQGNFTYDNGLSDRGRRLRNYLNAANAFSAIVDNPEHQFSHRLAPGECVIFNNRRVLHGRDSFDITEGERWLKGTYVDMQDFNSTLRGKLAQARQTRTVVRSTQLDNEAAEGGKSADIDLVEELGLWKDESAADEVTDSGSRLEPEPAEVVEEDNGFRSSVMSRRPGSD